MTQGDMKLCITCRHCKLVKRRGQYTAESYRPGEDEYRCTRSERWQKSFVTGETIQIGFATPCSEERAVGEGKCGPRGNFHDHTRPRVLVAVP